MFCALVEFSCLLRKKVLLPRRTACIWGKGLRVAVHCCWCSAQAVLHCCCTLFVILLLVYPWRGLEMLEFIKIGTGDLEKEACRRGRMNLTKGQLGNVGLDIIEPLVSIIINAAPCREPYSQVQPC